MFQSRCIAATREVFKEPSKVIGQAAPPVSAANGAEEFMSLDFTEIFSLRSEAHTKYRSTFIGQPMIWPLVPRWRPSPRQPSEISGPGQPE
jgi:hypothetical protein